MNKIIMLYYDRIDVSEGIDVNKTSRSKLLVLFKQSVLCSNHMYALDTMIY